MKFIIFFYFVVVIISKSSNFLNKDVDIILSDDMSPYGHDEASSKSNEDSVMDKSKGNESPKKGKECEEEDENVKVYENLIEIEEWLISG